MSVKFIIKHRSGGKFFHPDGGKSNPGNNTSVVLHGDIHDRMFWTFELVKDHWGYIKHVASGKIIHPNGGYLNPGNDTKLVVHGDRHHGALFAMDQVNDLIIHKGGKYAHPKDGRPNPGNDTSVVLHPDLHDGMRFLFVATNDTNKEVSIYGNPTVLGDWKIINMVRNPKAEHTDTLEVKIGRSKTESSTSTFQYEWETSVGAAIKIFTASASQSVKYMIEHSSSATWTEEATRTRTIKVSPGETVVTWQFVFDAEQNESHSVFQSNLLADTDSEDKIPDDIHIAL